MLLGSLPQHHFLVYGQLLCEKHDNGGIIFFQFHSTMQPSINVSKFVLLITLINNAHIFEGLFQSLFLCVF